MENACARRDAAAGVLGDAVSVEGVRRDGLDEKERAMGADGRRADARRRQLRQIMVLVSWFVFGGLEVRV